MATRLEQVKAYKQQHPGAILLSEEMQERALAVVEAGITWRELHVAAIHDKATWGEVERAEEAFADALAWWEEEADNA